MSDFRKITKEEWMREGVALFGGDMLKWRFKCVSCGNVQTAEDFRPFKDQGATPEDSYFNCIGRFKGGQKTEIFSGKKPCNYTSGGLFKLGPLIIIDGDREVVAFDFDRRGLK